MPEGHDPTHLDAARHHVVVITGGSSGIGLCTARLFARRGWRVGLIARGAAGLETAAASLRASGATVATAQADVADADQLDRAADALIDSLGAANVWINGAGVSAYGRFTDLPEAEFRRVMDVTFLGQVHGTRTALARLPGGRGSIVHIGSVAAFRGIPLQSPYCAAKFALRGFVESLRAELIHQGSRAHLTIVHPPSVNTPFFSHAAARLPPGHAGESPRPVPPVYQPELIAEAIWLAVSERRRELRVTGTTVQLSTLDRIFPRVMDRLVAALGVVSQRTARRDVAGLREPSLFAPASRGGTVHGPFGAETRRGSTQMWLQRHRTAVGLSAVGVLVALGSTRRRSG